MPTLATPTLALMGLQEMWPILLVVLLLFGGSKLPQLARAMGSSVNEFKKGMSTGQNDKDEPAKSADAPGKGG
jgi:sec-independent protein translocase protein TatA